MKREILHMSLSQREVPAAAGRPSRCVFLGPCWSLHRLVYFDALLGCWRQREGDGLRPEDWDLLVAVVVSADLTPA